MKTNILVHNCVIQVHTGWNQVVDRWPGLYHASDVAAVTVTGTATTARSMQFDENLKYIGAATVHTSIYQYIL